MKQLGECVGKARRIIGEVPKKIVAGCDGFDYRLFVTREIRTAQACHTATKRHILQHATKRCKIIHDTIPFQAPMHSTLPARQEKLLLASATLPTDKDLKRFRPVNCKKS